MRILLVNDDGINAPGIRHLQKALVEAGHKIIMVAPDRERSASSHSITLRKDISARKIGPDEWAISGTPVDCMVIALKRIVKGDVDLVVSGINAGQNMGEDLLYSGTVAAAVEASMFGYKAIALSVNAYEDQNYDSATRWFMEMFQKGLADLTKSERILNINFPNISYEEVRGLRLTKPGHRRYYNFVTTKDESEDGFLYRVGGSAPEWDLEDGTDSRAVNDGYISITPLGFKLTDPDGFQPIKSWIKSKNLLEL